MVPKECIWNDKGIIANIYWPPDNMLSTVNDMKVLHLYSSLVYAVSTFLLLYFKCGN